MKVMLQKMPNPKTKMSLKNKPEKIPSQSKDSSATQGMLLEFRSEMSERFNAQDHKLESKFQEVKSEIAAVKSVVAEVKSEVSEIKSMFHQALLRFEEQRADNRIVHEGHQLLNTRQDRLENEVKEVRENVKELVRTKSGNT